MVRSIYIGKRGVRSIILSGPKPVIIKGHAISIQIAVAITCNRGVNECAAVPKTVRNSIDFRSCLSNTLAKKNERFLEI